MSEDPGALHLLDLARKSRDDIEARLLLAAALQRVATSIGIQCVVTGGTAVDFYAAGAAGRSTDYPPGWRASGDVDIVALWTPGGIASRRALKRALVERLGLEPDPLGLDAAGEEVWGRALIVPGFPYGLEIVDDELLGDPERIWTVEIEGERVLLRGPEDTLLQYAEWGWHAWDGRSWERALAIYNALREDIDEDYLQRAAEARRMPRVLAALRELRPLPERREPLS